MYFKYGEEIEIENAKGEKEMTKSINGFDVAEVLDFKVVVTETVSEAIVRLKKTEIRLVPEQVFEGKKPTIKNVKREIFVTHRLTNKEDVEKFISIIGDY